MTVYIEYVFINNFVIDFFLLSAAFTITGKRDKAFKRYLAAAGGAAFALIYPLLDGFGAPTVFIKIVMGLTVVFAGAGYSSFKDYYVNAAVFFALTFAVLGVILGLSSIFNYDAYGETAVAFISVPVYFIIKGLKGVVKFLFTRAGEEKNFYDCEITFKGNTVKLKGFMDTGNSLYDGDSPVVVCNKKTALKIMGNNFPKVKYIGIATAAGKSKVLSFKVDEIKIFISDKANIFSNVTVAAAVNAGRGYDLILHPALKEIKNERDIAS